MTGLPKARQTEIRAELEDHLRARTADLMITGLPEPEAVQKAVNELGETAHLARQFRSALKPKRNTLMHTALIAAAGAAITLGAFSVTQNHAPAHHNAAHAAPAQSTQLIDIRGETYGGLFGLVSEMTPTPVLVHWDRLVHIGIEPDTEIGLDVDPLPSHVIHRLLTERAELHAGEPLVVQHGEDLIEFSTRSHFDTRTTTLVSYDVRDLVELKSGLTAADLARGESGEWHRGGEGVLDSVRRLVDQHAWAEHGGDTASGLASGASLLITAPARIHQQIENVLTILREDADRTRELAHAESEQRARDRAESDRRIQEERDERIARNAAEHRETTDQLKAVMNGYLERIVALEARKSELESERIALRNRATPNTRFVGETEEDARQRIAEAQEDSKTRVPALEAELTRIQIELEDTAAFRASARDRLLALGEELPILSEPASRHDN